MDHAWRDALLVKRRSDDVAILWNSQELSELGPSCAESEGLVSAALRRDTFHFLGRNAFFTNLHRPRKEVNITQKIYDKINGRLFFFSFGAFSYTAISHLSQRKIYAYIYMHDNYATRILARCPFISLK